MRHPLGRRVRGAAGHLGRATRSREARLLTGVAAARVPTLAPIIEGGWRGLQRFPLTVVAGLVAALAAILMLEEIGDEESMTRLLAASGLGISLLTGLRLFGERRGWRPRTLWLADALGVLILAGFFAGWADWSQPVRIARLFQVGAVFHLFVAFAPYVTGLAGRGFWEYNRSLLERLILAFIYTHVLYAGTAIAVLALDKLFAVPVADNGYLRLWFVAVLFLSPWFFVAGIPADLDALERREEYPRDLRAFARFALLPIVALYLLILLAYFVKVLVTWEWPSGWIGWLVSAVAVAGILSLLIVHPLGDRPGDRWVGTYARAFYALLVPAIVTLWLAIWQRVEQYGVTERRYFLIVLSLWLAGVAVYQLVTRARGIRVVPASLCLVGLVTAAGPWGAYRVSERSQVGRLARMLERNGMLADGRVHIAHDSVPREDQREISAVLHYLAETHGTGAVAEWFGGVTQLAAIDTVGKGTAPSEHGSARARLITAHLGIEYVAESERDRYQWFAYSTESSAEALPLAPYDSLLFVQLGTIERQSGLRAQAGASNRTIIVYRDQTPIVMLRLDSLLAALRGERRRDQASVPAARLRLDREVPGHRIALQLHSITGHWSDDTVTVGSFVGVVLVGRR